MSKKPLKVIAGAPDHPLVIGDIEIPCYVLEDETRVLSQQGFLTAIGRARKARAGQKDRVDNLPTFLSANNLKPYVSSDLIGSTTPIPFKPSHGGSTGYGYRAELLPQVCEVYLRARDAGALGKNQLHIAEQADILIRALATVGVIALVDEATGYQRIRVERALATILEKFIAKELQPWTKTFPYEFYEQIFRLKGWNGPHGHKRSPIIGAMTNDLVYARLAPAILDELRRKNPKNRSGNRIHRHHQWFTTEPGHPKLKEHLAAVIALMRASPNWIAFQRNMARSLPKQNEQFMLEIGD